MHQLSILRICFIFGIFLSSITPVSGDYNDLRFQRLTIEDGLSQSSVFCILQDKKGFIWFGTEDGLNKYDGINFETFRPDLHNPNSLSYNYISAILEDKSGLIWIGTLGGGLNRYDPETQTFKHYRAASSHTNGLQNDYIRSLCEDSSGLIWVGTDNGLNSYDPFEDHFKLFKHRPGDASSLSSNLVTIIYEDSSDQLWIGTQNGLNRLEREKGQFIHYSSTSAFPLILSDDSITSICEGEKGELWVGTENGLNRMLLSEKKNIIFPKKIRGPNNFSHSHVYSTYRDRSGIIWIGTINGLNRYDRPNNRFVTFYADPYNPDGLVNNEILSIFQDKLGVLWIGTHIGISKLDLEQKLFYNFRAKPNHPNSLSHNYVYSIFEDSRGKIWFGTYGGGLNAYNPVTRSYVHYIHHSDQPGGLSNNYVRAILEDESGTLWVGTYGGGLNRLIKGTKLFKHFKNDAENDTSISSDFIRCMIEDSSGSFWIGTADGLNLFDAKTQKFKHFKALEQDPYSLSNDFIYAVFEDSFKELWIGTIYGLNRLDRRSGRFYNFFADREKPGSLSSSEILSIFEDSKGVLWFGTSMGLNKYDRNSSQFTFYTEKDGLSNDVIYAIEEDERGFLWISTNKGLSRFDPVSEKFKAYDVKDGIQSNEFSLGASLQRDNGEMFFGGVNGVTAFIPEIIRENPYIPPIVITDFQILNKSVPVGERVNGSPGLRYSITYTQEIKISHRDRVISFEFAALHYAAPSRNHYAFKLEGFDEDWNYVGNRRFATYSNLPPGKYTFRVKGSNNDGLWNESGTSLKISVTPPYWRTLWFQIVSGFVVLLSMFSIYRYRTRTIKAQNIQLEKRVEERTKELQQEIMERKRLEQAAEKRAAQAGLIYKVGKRVSSELELDELLKAIVTTICETFNYYGVLLLLKEKGKNILTMRAFAGGFVGTFPKSLSIPLGKGMIGHSAATGVTQVSGDVDKNPYFFRKEREETKSELSVPIKSGKEIIGVLDIQGDEYDAFDSMDVAAMETLSAQLGTAIENARLYDKAQREISERKKVEKKIKSALSEKEVLLKEIHHRVKNNMQIISSLLRMQSRMIKDSFAVEAFKDSQVRIKSMALIHETLYRSDDFSMIKFSDYIRILSQNLMTTYANIGDVDLELDVKGIYLDINRAIPCGLIINELVSNSLKHAFNEGKPGAIKISMHKKKNKKYVLTISDSGIGIPERIDIHNTETLGLQLVSGLVSQLMGTVKLERDDGAKFIISFK